MIQNLFKVLPAVDASFLQRIFGQRPEENSVIELNNLLATKAIKDITLNDITNIENEYNINFANDFHLNLEEFYATYYNYCVQNKTLGGDTLEELNHLKQVLSLDLSVVSMLQDKIGEETYRKSYAEAIKSGELLNEKEGELKKLQTDLNLSEETTSKISSESRKQFMDIQLKRIISSGKISPHDWDEFTSAGKNLKIDIQIDDKTKAQLEKMKLYWLIENGELPVMQVDISLQKGEVCYYSFHTDWLEHRSVTKRVNYSGPVFRMKIVKGLSYRVGSINVQRITADQVQVIDSGTIYLTNHRVIFVGTKKNTNIKLDKILSIVPYSDGVEIEKDSGRSPILRVRNDADILAMTLSRLINDAK